jgi:glycosyltransferase involved in cell wall biosynthesis
MKILIVAPVPPPYSGNSLPVKILYESLSKDHQVEVINLNKKQHRSGFAFSRLLQMISILWRFQRLHSKYDLIYVTLAESVAGNMRDIAMYWLARKRLSSVVVHMFGGAGMEKILDKKSSKRFSINRYFLSKLGAILVEGVPQANSFARVAKRARIHVIPNFAEDYLFHDDEEIDAKFADIQPLRVLFLSNMLLGKGHMELLTAFKQLPAKIKDKLCLDFAGKLVTGGQDFLSMIGSEENVKYHGPVYDQAKRNLYGQAHVFCLPTYYPYEGQPFCILEAYAAGCVVVTTNHSGISQVFREGVNGFEVEKQNIPALTNLLLRLSESNNNLKAIGFHNVVAARQRYTQERFLQSAGDVFEQISPDTSSSTK